MGLGRKGRPCLTSGRLRPEVAVHGTQPCLAVPLSCMQLAWRSPAHRSAWASVTVIICLHNSPGLPVCLHSPSPSTCRSPERSLGAGMENWSPLQQLSGAECHRPFVCPLIFCPFLVTRSLYFSHIFRNSPECHCPATDGFELDRPCIVKILASPDPFE